jgi:hypothetical protein
MDGTVDSRGRNGWSALLLISGCSLCDDPGVACPSDVRPGTSLLTPLPVGPSFGSRHCGRKEALLWTNE